MLKIRNATPLLTVTLLTSVVVATGGCRQTTGPANSGTFSSVSPLAPVAAGQTPVLGPFGGSTRVAPPATGSFSQQPANNYLSPTTQPQASYAPPPQSFGTPPPASAYGQPNANFGFEPIGSGVQPASFTETGATIPSNNPDPRRGGMQVIDLTGAPNPPGYQPMTMSYASQQSIQPVYAPAPDFSPAPNYAPAQGSFGNPAWQPITSPSTQAYAPETGRIASTSMVPVQTPTPSTQTSQRPQSNVPTTQPSTGETPSTLPWRRPGTQY
ncbi:hypothetical protein Poly51_15830 [Rubripirellula tenax]|uniref:IgA FC receptor n=1 Tax=Rubripirellula tenax TaxID=2528015 RepID=A0A5C6FAJ6_9BACT|nr:hypothetical protein [Rubripirellula tenax]TWU58803.1 hypothetical protein Poly51_15830 [Rubripirellula tenax]